MAKAAMLAQWAHALEVAFHEEHTQADAVLQDNTTAATRIQKHWRGFKTRKEADSRQRGATLVQAGWRGIEGRRYFGQVQRTKAREDREAFFHAAAIAVQKCVPAGDAPEPVMDWCGAAGARCRLMQLWLRYYRDAPCAHAHGPNQLAHIRTNPSAETLESIRVLSHQNCAWETMVLRCGCRYNLHCARRAIGHSGQAYTFLHAAGRAARAPRLTGCGAGYAGAGADISAASMSTTSVR